VLRTGLRGVTFRRAAYAVAVGMAGTTLLASVAESHQPVSLAALVIPVAAGLAFRWPRHRATILSVGAGVLAFWVSSHAGWLWPGLAALVFAAVVEDDAPVTWRGWAGGFAGSVASLVLMVGGNVAPFLATAVGAGSGHLVRARSRALALAAEADELRVHAAWLEQRTNLARELHDVVGHHVTAMVVQAEAGQMGDAGAALRSVAHLGRTALGELDQLVVHLRDPNAAITVSAPPRLRDIDELLAAPLRQRGMQVSVAIDDELGLDEAQVRGLYRIAQEALTNVVRHARAEHAWVELHRPAPDRVRLRVSDDGVGPPAAPARGSGLMGIRERVAALGGIWEMATRPGGGTMLDVLVPVAPP
jgi:signal transduction histidine kinase